MPILIKFLQKALLPGSSTLFANAEKSSSALVLREGLDVGVRSIIRRVKSSIAHWKIIDRDRYINSMNPKRRK